MVGGRVPRGIMGSAADLQSSGSAPGHGHFCRQSIDQSKAQGKSNKKSYLLDGRTYKGSIENIVEIIGKREGLY